MSIEIIPIGGDGGSDFPIEAVKSIALRSGERIDALIINGQQHGRNGGRESVTLELQADEYINKITVWSKGRIHALEFTTNRGRQLSGGQRSGDKTELTNIRVLALGGRAGEELDKLRVHLVRSYSQSRLIERGVPALIDIIPPGETIERSTELETARLSASTRIMETVFNVSVSAETSAIGSFISGMTASSSLTQTTRSEITNVVESKERTSERRTYTPPDGSVGLEFMHVDVFQEDNGFTWLFPVSDPELVSVSMEQGISNLKSVYDLTRLLAIQVPVMAKRLDQKNGYDFYPVIVD